MYKKITSNQLTLKQQLDRIEHGHSVNLESIIAQAIQLSQMPLKDFFKISMIDTEWFYALTGLEKKRKKHAYTYADAVTKISYGNKIRSQTHTDHINTKNHDNISCAHDMEITDSMAQVILLSDPIYMYSGTQRKHYPLENTQSKNELTKERSDE